MIYLYAAIIVLYTLLPSTLCGCPAIYQRFSKDHSYCKPRNSNCPLTATGVTEGEKQQILDAHNKYRSLVATGREKRAGGLPQASDMLEMVWDNELAAIAQKRAEQCIYEHDCNACRRVENFGVGQNAAKSEGTCSGKCPSRPDPKWGDIIKGFYEEVKDFHKQLISPYQMQKSFGHFSQVVWSKSWRVGCGFISYKNGNGYINLYFCNYGPAGNGDYDAVYTPGRPCSGCPGNTCCGSSCPGSEGPSKYEGLCRVLSNNQGPVYKSKDNLIFDCDWDKLEGDCSIEVQGANWVQKKTLEGGHIEAVLKGGQKHTLTFKNPIQSANGFCVRIYYVAGPNIDGQQYSNKVELGMEMPDGQKQSSKLRETRNQSPMNFGMAIPWGDATKISLTFSVPNGSPPQYFQINHVTAKPGRC